MRFEEVWASFQAIGWIAIAAGLGLALLMVLVVSPAVGGLVLLLIGAFVAYRITSARQAADERGVLARAVLSFRELAGPPTQPADASARWTPEEIHRRAVSMSSTEALHLGVIYRQLTDENAALNDVLEERPGVLILVVRAFRGNTNRDVLSALLLDIGQRARKPVWDRFVWQPQEALLRAGRGPVSVTAGAGLEAEFSDAQDATAHAAHAALLAGWAPGDDVDWLLRPWSSVFGATSNT